jgi:hypothetical protein
MKSLAGVALLGMMAAVAACPYKALRAQEAPAPPAEQATAQNALPAIPAVVLLKEGTEVRLKLAQEITGRAAVVGEPVEFLLAEDLRVGDAVVVREGARVLGSVMEGKASEKKRGQPKSLRIRVDFLKAGDSKIPLRGEQAAVGKRDQNAMITGTVILGVPGLLLTMGKKYQIPAGTPVTAYVNQDVELPPLK